MLTLDQQCAHHRPFLPVRIVYITERTNEKQFVHTGVSYKITSYTKNAVVKYITVTIDGLAVGKCITCLNTSRPFDYDYYGSAQNGSII